MGIKTDRLFPPRIIINPSLKYDRSYIKQSDKHWIKEDNEFKKYINRFSSLDIERRRLI